MKKLILVSDRMIVKEIDLEKRFSKKIGMKSTVRTLFKEFENCDEVILDFKNVEFISRSFAQEYVFLRYHSKVKIIEKGMNEFIKGLLDVVEDDFKETCLS